MGKLDQNWAKEEMRYSDVLFQGISLLSDALDTIFPRAFFVIFCTVRSFPKCSK